MRNNFCEEQTMQDPVLDFHEKMMTGIGLPKWANHKCPFCKSELPLRAVRSISLKLNTRNYGDIAVEFYCDFCQLMDTIYYRRAAKTIDDFVKCLQGQSPEALPVVEEDMYRLQYNNVVDAMTNSGEGKEKGDAS